MTAPESRPDIESTLADAFRRRHAGQPAGHPSLVDVRRRAHRRSNRRAAARTGALVAAGAAVVAGGWAVTRHDSASSSAAPVTEQRALGVVVGGGPESVTLSVDGLWSAVAAQLGTTMEQLDAANPSVDFTKAPVPGTAIQIPVGVLEEVTETTVTWPAVSPTVTAVHTTVPVPADPTVATTITMASDWTPYVIATGDYLVAIAERFCTTADELVAGNGWADGVGVPLYPGDLIVVPADAC